MQHMINIKHATFIYVRLCLVNTNATNASLLLCYVPLHNVFAIIISIMTLLGHESCNIKSLLRTPKDQRWDS